MESGLTRYLYVKERVEYSLFCAILEKSREESNFWAYELYFSGFTIETVRFLWNLYFRIYSTKYPNLELFLRLKTEEWMNNRSKYWIIGTMVENLVRKEITLDEKVTIEVLWNIVNNKNNDQVLEFSRTLQNTMNSSLIYIENIESKSEIIDTIIHKINTAIHSEELLMISEMYIDQQPNSQFQHLWEQTFQTIKIISTPVNYLHNLKYACISRTFTYFYYFHNRKTKNTDKKIKMDTKKFSILVEIDVLKYISKPFIEYHAWKVLSKLLLFPIRNPKSSIRELTITDYDNWLFYADISPIWEKRISKYSGKMNKHKKIIEFSNNDQEEQFYNWYNLEPDEQPIHIQNKWFGRI
jgi:hypothetical protein